MVVITNMDMPESCYVCKIRNCCKKAHDNGWLCNRRDNDCPLKSADETFKTEYAEDCISRASALNLMRRNWNDFNGDDAMQKSIIDIRALPSVTPQEPITKIEESNFSQEQYLVDTDTAYQCGYAKGLSVLEDIKSELWMEGVNMGGEYQGVWVRFKDIEKVVDKHISRKEQIDGNT